jgi:hypothetical protein
MKKLELKLFSFISSNNLEKIEKLLCDIIEIEETKYYINFILQWSAYYNKFNIVRYILINFKNKITDVSLNYTLREASFRDNFYVVKLIMQYKNIRENNISKIKYKNIIFLS